MNRLIFGLAVISLLTMAAGAFATPPASSFPWIRVTEKGHVYLVRGNFQGLVDVSDEKHQLVDVTATGGEFGQGDPVHGEVDIKVDGASFVFHGPGRYDLRDSKGVLHGYAKLTPISNQSVEAVRKEWNQTPARFEDLIPWVIQGEPKPNFKDGAQGFSSGPYYISGWDSKVGVYWLVRGLAQVTMIDAGGRFLGSEILNRKEIDSTRSTAPADIKVSDQELKNPRIAFTVNGKTTYERGYGTYPIKDPTGKLLVTVKVSVPVGPKS